MFINETTNGTPLDSSWLPIYKIQGSGFYIGITSDNQWVIETNNSLFSLDASNRAIPIMELLELQPSEFYSAFYSACEEKGILKDIQQNFPVKKVIETGINQKSDYWCSLALNWLQALPMAEIGPFKSQLMDILEEKWLSQKTKQRIKKLLKF
ncbi:hypothetical protein [Spartinivicinus ruber]|uniref:hypothetical protein n=1 Tax=Spartinivicinus ruber TaxID=2683272 RepID=UPI0013D6B1EB|nr:hypothetical protein [Spartinivicinus ruber]